MNTPYAYAVVQGEDGRENVSLQFDHPEMCGQQYNEVLPLYTTSQTKPAPEGLIDPKSYYIGYEDGKKAPQTKPLTYKEIMKMAEKSGFVLYKNGIDWSSDYDEELKAFARMVRGE